MDSINVAVAQNRQIKISTSAKPNTNFAVLSDGQSLNVKNVVVAQKRPIQISTNATSTAIVTNNPINLRPDTSFTVLSGGGVNELDQLLDVDITLEQDGSVLQYNAVANNYQVKPLIVDGGEY